MNRYYITLDGFTIYSQSGCEFCYELFKRVCKVAELTGERVELIDCETDEVIATNEEE